MNRLARPLLALALFALCLVGCSSGKLPRAPTPGVPHLEVLTYNVNYGLAGDEETLRAIAHADADIVFLQETNEEWERALRRRLSEAYPHMEFRHCCLAGGLAVLSRHPFEERAYVEPVTSPEGDGWFPAWVVVVDSPLGPLQVLNVHLHPPVSDSGSVVSGYFSTPPIRREEIARFYQHLDPALPTLVVGDFNEGPGGRAVVFLERRGFQSGLEQFDTEQDTWRWQTSLGSVSTQLDHIVHDPRLEPLEVRVIPLGRSDHLPVFGVFERTAAPAPVP